MPQLCIAVQHDTVFGFSTNSSIVLLFLFVDDQMLTSLASIAAM